MMGAKYDKADKEEEEEERLAKEADDALDEEAAPLVVEKGLPADVRRTARWLRLLLAWTGQHSIGY